MKKRTPQGLALILVLILMALFVNKCLANTSNIMPIGMILNIQPYELNKCLPIGTNKNTRVVNAKYISPKSSQINYVLHDMDWDKFDLKYLRTQPDPNFVRQL